MTWLNDLQKSHEELESPQSFWFWAGLAAISAVVKDQIWFNKQIYNLYPNIYVMFHADSGVKKGPPVNMAKRFVSAVNNTRVISGRSSIQGILKDMGTAQTEPGGKIKSTSTAFICSSELTSSIVEDKVATTILTDLFDRNYNEGEWRSLLKMEQFTLKNPCITSLTATNEGHSSEFFTGQDMHGGYFARTFIIYEKISPIVNSLMFPLKNPPNDAQAIEYLKRIEKLRGPFEMEDSTRIYFDNWYRNFKAELVGFQDKTGTLNRFDDSVLKVAMLLSLGTEPRLVITQESVEWAIRECEKLVGNIRRVTVTKGAKHDHAPLKAMVIEELLTRTNHSLSRTQLHKKYWMHANAPQWDEIMMSLEAAGIVRCVTMGNQLLYEMPDTMVETWKQHFAGKNIKDK